MRHMLQYYNILHCVEIFLSYTDYFIIPKTFSMVENWEQLNPKPSIVFSNVLQIKLVLLAVWALMFEY